MRFLKLLDVARNLEAEGGAGAGAAAADPAPGSGSALARAAADGQPAQNDAAAAAAAADPAPAAEPYWPKDFPDTFKGANEKETLDKIAADYAGRPKAPEKPEGYELKLPDHLMHLDSEDDTVVPVFRQVAHEIGMTNDQFNNFITKFHDKMVEGGLYQPVDVEAELVSLAPNVGDQASRMAAGKQRLNSALSNLGSALKRGEFSKDEARTIGEMAKTAKGVQAIEAILKRGAPLGVQPGGEGGGGTPNLTDHERAARALYPQMFKS